MNTTKDLSTNIQAFETFVMNGSFAEKQQSEKNCKAAKEALKSKLYHSEEKRHVFDKHGMVAKFVTSEVKDTDQSGLIEDILDYIRSEALSQVISFNKKYLEANELLELLEPYQYDPTYYLKATLNTNGKSYSHSLEEDFHEQDIEFLLKSVKSYTQQFDSLQNEYKSLLNPFHAMSKMKVQTAVGSISKVANKPVWDVHRIVNELGDDFVVNHGEVKLTKLQEWIQIGAFPKDLLSARQQVIDIQLKFVVMSLEAESRAFNAYQFKRSQLSV